MADILKTAIEHLRDTFKEHVSRTVTYRRGAGSVSVSAVVIFQDEGLDNAIQIERSINDFNVPNAEEYSRTYLIDPADLVISSTTILPAQGDYIDDTNDASGVTHRYKVYPPTGRPEYEKDGYVVWLRVHTKHYGVVA